MRGHNVCFYTAIRTIIPILSVTSSYLDHCFYDSFHFYRQLTLWPPPQNSLSKTFHDMLLRCMGTVLEKTIMPFSFMLFNEL